MTEPLDAAAAQDAKRVLRARARLLSRPSAAVPVGGDMLEVLEFRLAGEHYALEARHVREVYPLRNLAPLPCTPPFLIGVVNVRGRIVPIVDLKTFFGLPERGLTDLHRVIVVGDEASEFGILADAGVDARAIPLASLHAPLSTLSGIGAEYVKGITVQRLVVLDTDRILADPRIVVDEVVE